REDELRDPREGHGEQREGDRLEASLAEFPALERHARADGARDDERQRDRARGDGELDPDLAHVRAVHDLGVQAADGRVDHFARSRTAAKKPSVSCLCGRSFRESPPLWAFCVPCRSSTSGAFTMRKSGCEARNPVTTSSFSSVSRLHVPYTRRPPGFTSDAAAARLAPCLAFNSTTLSAVCLNLRSGLRLSVPSPVHGASTSTRSILPRSLFTFASCSPAMRCGKTLESPERLRRGARFARRLSETSKA